MTDRILIVDDQELLRRGLRLLLERTGGIEVVDAVASGAEALAVLASRDVDVVLADAVMPGMSGPKLITECRRRFPSVPVVILTTFDTESVVRESLEAGAAGFLLKDVSPGVIAEAVTAARGGGLYIDPRVTRLIAAPAPDVCAGLTTTESAVARLVGQGLSNQEIARSLHLAEGTVKNHVSALFRKTGLPDRVRLALHFHGHSR